MKPLVSVVIPVYNTAQYLDNCIQSVYDQTLSDWEIILVDDGAKDASPAICDAWAKKDKRIHVIHKQNEGLGLTRNAGIKAATGEFICFLDSDDTIDPKTLECCVHTLQSEQASACFYGRKTQGKDGRFTVNTQFPEQLVYVGEEVKKKFARIYIGTLPYENPSSYIQASACCGMYRRSIIADHAITFMSERVCLSEDTFFNLTFCLYADKIVILPEDFYNYTYNAGSLTKSYNPNKINQTKAYIGELEKYALSYAGMDKVKERIAYSFYIYFRHAMEYEVKAWNLNGIAKTYGRVRELCNDPFLQEHMKKVCTKRFDKKKKLFVSLFLHKQALLIMLYYMKK